MNGDNKLVEGLTIEETFLVTPMSTAMYVGSGKETILATPVLVGWMESTCQALIAPYIGEDMQTVGTGVNITHDEMTPIWKNVKVKCQLAKIETRKLQFLVEAREDEKLIAQGKHDRILAKTVTIKRMLRKNI